MRIALWLTVWAVDLWAGCALPPAHDLRRAEYQLEKIASSVTVALEFPKLSDLNCSEEKVDFGTIWRVPLDAAHAIQVRVTDLNQNLVQKFALTGEVELKVTSSWSALRFFNAVPSKKLLDHRLVSLDLISSFSPSPSIAVDDQGQRRSFPAQVQVW